METALATISVLPSGKSEVARFKRILKEEILANTSDPLKTFVQLKYIEQTIADTLKDSDIEDHILKEFELYGKEKVIEVLGAKLNAQETGVKYFYEDSGDPIWIDLNKQIAELTEKRKSREKMLQVIPPEGMVEPTTGVYVTRPPRTSKTKVVCKLF